MTTLTNGTINRGCTVDLPEGSYTEKVWSPPPPPEPTPARISFRSSRIIYYGPHACENCGATICKMGREWGGNAFTYPDGPIYPNTEWHPHVCDPKLVAKHAALQANTPAAEAPTAPPSLTNLNPPVFDGAVCRGSFVLGSACGKCERCQWVRQKLAALIAE